MQKEITPEQAETKLKALCSLREICEKDAKDRLQKWGVEEEAQEMIVRHLVQERFIDDERFANIFVRDKHNLSHWGKSRIIRELKSRKIATRFIDEAIGQIPDEAYSEQLEEILKKKLGSIKGKTPYEIGGKLIRFGLSRGYESSLVIKTAKKLVTDINTSDYENGMDNL